MMALGLLSCINLEIMPPDLPCREAGYAIAARTDECLGDLDFANAQFESFEERFVCIEVDVTDPRVNGPAIDPVDLFDCAFAIRELPCEWIDLWKDDVERYLLISDACPWVIQRRDGLPLGTGVDLPPLPTTEPSTSSITPPEAVERAPSRCVSLPAPGSQLEGSDAFFPRLGDARTLAVWVRAAGPVSGEAYALSYGALAPSQSVLLGLLGGSAVATNNGQSFVGPTGLDDGAWHHLALTVSGASWRMVVDGLPAGAATLSSATERGGAFVVGNTLPGDGDKGLRGWIDDVAVWTRVLTDDELRAAAEGSLPPEGLLRHYDFEDESTYGTFTDANGENGLRPVGAAVAEDCP